MLWVAGSASAANTRIATWATELMMRRLLLTMLYLAVLAGCQSGGSRSIEPKSCDPRELESGRCVPGEYEAE